MQVADLTFKFPSPSLPLLGSNNGKVTNAADAGNLALRPPSPDPEVKEAFKRESSARNNIVEEDNPLAEFKAWITSGAVHIVDKL